MQAQAEKAMELLLREPPEKLKSNQLESRQLFDLNKIELKQDSLPEKVAKRVVMTKDWERLAMKERMAWVRQWYDEAKNSASVRVREHCNVIWHVAAIVYSLKQVGVQELVIYDSKYVPFVVSQAAFNTDAGETLQRIVDAARSNFVAREVEAWAHPNQDFIAKKDTALLRLALIFALVDVLVGKWSSSRNKFVQNEHRETTLKQVTILVSWITMAEIRSIWANASATGSSSAQPRSIFIIGMPNTGKSTTRWLLADHGSQDIGRGGGQKTKYVNCKSDDAKQVMVWDTPGLSNNDFYKRIYERRIKAEMMREDDIAAVVWQVKKNRKPATEEISVLQDLNTWFERQLKEILMIAFRVEKESSAATIEDHKKTWDSKLSEHSIGSIGKQNYICLDANTTEINKSATRLANAEEIGRVKSLLLAKNPRGLRNPQNAHRAMTNSEARSEPQLNIVRDARQGQVADERSTSTGDTSRRILEGAYRVKPTLRSILEGAYSLKPTFIENERHIHLRVDVQKKWPSGNVKGKVQEFTKQKCSPTGRSLYYFEAQTVPIKEFLIRISNQDVPSRGERDKIKKWVGNLFNTYKIVDMENNPDIRVTGRFLVCVPLEVDEAIAIASKLVCPGTLRCAHQAGGR